MSRPRRLPTDLPRTTPGGIACMLNMVHARLQADPDTVEEWIAIEMALRKAANAAGAHRACRSARNGAPS